MVIVGEGTPEPVWQAWGLDFAPLSLDGCERLVVVAPHPDDEVLGVGGLMALAAQAGIGVHLVAVTDGGASHPGSPTLSPAQLLAIRPGESAAALAALGVPATQTRLGLPDGAVAEHQAQLVTALSEVLGDGGVGTWVLSTWRGDGHPDHEATGRAAAAACTPTGVRLLEFPVWTWHWSHPDDPRVPWERARALPLPEPVYHAKIAAAQCFTTQVRPLSEHPADAAVLGGHVLARLLREQEAVFV